MVWRMDDLHVSMCVRAGISRFRAPVCALFLRSTRRAILTRTHAHTHARTHTHTHTQLDEEEQEWVMLAERMRPSTAERRRVKGLLGLCMCLCAERRRFKGVLGVCVRARVCVRASN